MTQAGRSPLDAWIEQEFAASERRRLLVDGFNVLHTALLAGARDTSWWGREARERLLERVSAWPVADDEIWVAFDGSQPAWSVFALPANRTTNRTANQDRGPTVHSLFVTSADDWIVRRARRAVSPERTLVVSADQQVAGRARSAGCEVWTPWAFIAQCRTTADPGQEPESSVGSAEAAPCGPRPSPNVLS